jgi:hypothetical protein
MWVVSDFLQEADVKMVIVFFSSGLDPVISGSSCRQTTPPDHLVTQNPA